MPQPQPHPTQADTFSRVKAGVYRRADGIEIRRMTAPQFRSAFKGATTTEVVWVAFGPNSLALRRPPSPWPVSGSTLSSAIDDVAKYDKERELAVEDDPKDEPDDDGSYRRVDSVPDGCLFWGPGGVYKRRKPLDRDQDCGIGALLREGCGTCFSGTAHWFRRDLQVRVFGYCPACQGTVNPDTGGRIGPPRSQQCTVCDPALPTLIERLRTRRQEAIARRERLRAELSDAEDEVDDIDEDIREAMRRLASEATSGG